MNTVDNQPKVGNLRTFSEILGLRVSNQNKFLTTKAPTLLQKNRTSSHITILVLFKVSFTSDMLIYFLNILTVIICHITHNHFVVESFLISKSVTLTNFSVKPSIYQLYSVILPYLPRQAPISIPLKDLLRSSAVFGWLSNMATLSSGRMDVLTRNYIFSY